MDKGRKLKFSIERGRYGNAYNKYKKVVLVLNFVQSEGIEEFRHYAFGNEQCIVHEKHEIIIYLIQSVGKALEQMGNM